MSCKLQELEKLCKKYSWKKRWPILFIIVIFSGVGLFFLQNSLEGKKVERVHTKDKKTDSVTKKHDISGDLKYCYSLQFLSTYDRFRDKLKRKERRLEKLGFDCREKVGKVTKKGRELFLVCNTVKSTKTLHALKQLARYYKLSFVIVKDDCRYAKKYRVVIPKKSIVKQKERRAQQKHGKEQKKQKSEKIVFKSETFDPQRAQALYERRPSYMLAIKLAKYYYEKGKYKEALFWAKKANRLDQTQEEAWIYYARSLYAMGKRNQAKRVLEIFLEYKMSERAKKLLKKWK